MKFPTIRAIRRVPTGPVRIHARRVALGATVFALVVYLAVCAIADVLVVGHLNDAIDARLSSRLYVLSHATSDRSVEAGGSVTNLSNNEDLDDTPILAWAIPRGSTSAQRLDNESPGLPSQYFNVQQAIDARIGGREFRVEGMTSPSERFVVATSNRQVGGVLSTLLIIEGALAPIALASLFIAASIIGRRAAAPIERARVRQLEFTADASHELRTPLSVIEAEVGLALSSKRSAPAYHQALERIADESKRLRTIVDDLLWLARLDALPAGPKHEPVDIGTVVADCSERFVALAGQRDITLTATESGAFPAVLVAPADWLDRLVSVLLDNACRYADDKGQIKIHVAVDEDRVRLIVDDSGPGFRDSEREYLLQRFHRASSISGGAGLGLAIATAVVKATGGGIELASSPLGGARVAISWRRCALEDQSDPLLDRRIAFARD